MTKSPTLLVSGYWPWYEDQQDVLSFVWSNVGFITFKNTMLSLIFHICLYKNYPLCSTNNHPSIDSFSTANYLDEFPESSAFFFRLNKSVVFSIYENSSVKKSPSFFTAKWSNAWRAFLVQPFLLLDSIPLCTVRNKIKPRQMDNI